MDCALDGPRGSPWMDGWMDALTRSHEPGDRSIVDPRSLMICEKSPEELSFHGLANSLFCSVGFASEAGIGFRHMER